MILASGLAVLAALLNAVGDLAQRRSARVEPGPAGPALVLRMVRRPGWVAGVVASLAGLGAHVAALSLGAIAAVQPLLVLELPLAVAGAALLFRVRPTARDVGAIVLLTAGLAALVFCLRPGGGDATAVSGPAWAVGLAVVGGTAVLLGVAARWSVADQRAGLLGAAAGTGYGLTAVLMATAGAVIVDDPGAALGTWQLYAAAGAGLASFVTLQNALASGLLVAVGPGLTLLNPIVGVGWGLLLFGEHARTGVWLLGAFAGAAALVAGTVLLARSPLLRTDPRSAAGAPAGRGA